MLKNFINFADHHPTSYLYYETSAIPKYPPKIFLFWVFHWGLSGVSMTTDYLLSYGECTQLINRANGLSLSHGSSKLYFLVKRLLGFEGYWHSNDRILYKISLLNAVVCWPLFWFQSEDRLLAVKTRKGRKGGWESDHKALSFFCVYKRWTIAKLPCDKIMLHLVSFLLPCDVLI